MMLIKRRKGNWDDVDNYSLIINYPIPFCLEHCPAHLALPYHLQNEYLIL